MYRVSVGAGAAFTAGATFAVGELCLTVGCVGAGACPPGRTGCAGVAICPLGCIGCAGAAGRVGGVTACTGEAIRPWGGAVPAVPGPDCEVGAVDLGWAGTGWRLSCRTGLGVVTGADALVDTETSFLLCRGARSDEGAIEGAPIPAVPWLGRGAGLATGTGVAPPGRLSCVAVLETSGVLDGSADTGVPFLPCRVEGLDEIIGGDAGFPAVPGRLAVPSATERSGGVGRVTGEGWAFAVPETSRILCRVACWVDLVSEREICS